MKIKKKLIGSIVIAVIVIIFSIVSFINSKKTDNNQDIFIESEANEETTGDTGTQSKETSSFVDVQKSESIEVEIKGEIKKPGVYTMEQGSRLEDLITKAGGFSKNADRNNMPSLAKKLQDEECIVIYNKKDPDSKKNLVTANAASDTSGEEQEVVNINTADSEELQKINGVGPATAQNIIDYREKNGGFKTIEDIKNVDRIGEKTFEKMKDSITVQ